MDNTSPINADLDNDAIIIMTEKPISIHDKIASVVFFSRMNFIPQKTRDAEIAEMYMA